MTWLTTVALVVAIGCLAWIAWLLGRGPRG